MAFTWVGDLSTDLDKVRFYIGDTDSSGYYLEDATITALLNAGSVGSAVIAGILYIIRQLNKPDFKADWLQVTNAEAVKGWERHLTAMRQEFGIPAIAASVVHVYRADSYATSEPDYSEGA